MKRAAKFFWVVVFGLIILEGSCYAAEKLAYVDLSRLFSEYNKTKDYDKVLGDKQTTVETEWEKKAGEVKQLQDKMNLLSEKEKESKKTDLENRVKSLKEFERQKQADLRKEQDEKMKEILKDIENTVKQYAEKEGYDLVFNDRVLVYQTKAMDITDKIIGMLNKDYKK